MTAILDDFKLSYLSVPKVACTSIKTMMFEIENGFPYRNFTISGRAYWIHHFYKSTLFAAQDVMAMRDHQRLAVVRDPIGRLLSCYSNRVVHHRELSKEKARKALKTADLPFNPDLSTFVAHLERYMAAVESINHHARPMVDYLGRDAGFYTRLYGMSEVQTFVDDVNRITGRTVALQRLQTGGPKITADALTAAEIARLKTFYARDYDTFGSKL